MGSVQRAREGLTADAHVEVFAVRTAVAARCGVARAWCAAHCGAATSSPRGAGATESALWGPRGGAFKSPAAAAPATAASRATSRAQASASTTCPAPSTTSARASARGRGRGGSAARGKRARPVGGSPSDDSPLARRRIEGRAAVSGWLLLSELCAATGLRVRSERPVRVGWPKPRRRCGGRFARPATR